MADSTTKGETGKSFMCGVVEGFYGRPWTAEQRKDLFTKMKKWNMDSYLYAPKDDYKHRAYWRDLYTVEEAEHLTNLISASKENGIRFVYAISPGLDIVYSASKDVSALKRKLEQVNQLGCDAFAVLFDDIDPEMSKADKEVFKSFAHAQVSVTNEVYHHVNVDRFLFCPTQYCATRAVPNVCSSEYLRTIGSKLDPGIDVMWTGNKVISKEITLESVEEISDVLKRPPVIWDNLHANDYDQKRLFLGPYSGRSTQLIPRLRGVMTNPNCEYEANFVAIHTLAQWSKCSIDAKNQLESADAKLEAETENGTMELIPESLEPNAYHPVFALRKAIREWLEEFSKQKSVWGPIIKPQIVSVPTPLLPSVNTCIDVTGTTSTTTTCSASSNTLTLPPPSVPPVPTVNCTSQELTAIVENGGNALDILSSPVAPTIMNSLASENKIICADSIQTVAPENSGSASSLPPVVSINNSEADITEMNMNEKEPELGPGASQTSSAAGLEPMDCHVITPNSSPTEASALDRSSEDIMMTDSGERGFESACAEDNLDSANVPSSSMQVEVQEDSEVRISNSGGSSDELSEFDVSILCDLFYLPFEHGPMGLKVLSEFQWLKTNANVIAGIGSKDKCKPEVAEWHGRAEKFKELKESVDSLTEKLNAISNRELLYELYPYIWDIRGVVSLLHSYIKWLALGHVPTSVTSYVHGSYTWFSKGWREAFTSGDQEPWVIRGGLTAELQRLIPVDRGTDLYMYKAPELPSSEIYTVRPYRKSDEESVYKVCLSTFKDGLSASEELSDIPHLPGDLKVGAFLSLDAQISFVVEDESENIVGIAVAAFNGKEFRRKINVSWVKILREKYPLPTAENDFLKEAVVQAHTDLEEIPEELTVSHPAELRFSVMTRLVDPSVPKRLMTCILAALRANGVFGCFIEVKENEKLMMEMFKKLGFKEIYKNFLGRSF